MRTGKYGQSKMLEFLTRLQAGPARLTSNVLANSKRVGTIRKDLMQCAPALCIRSYRAIMVRTTNEAIDGMVMITTESSFTAPVAIFFRDFTAPVAFRGSIVVSEILGTFEQCH